MQKILLLAALAIATTWLSGCATRHKSEAHIYEGDAPNIRYAPSSAGGPQSYY